MAVQNSDLLVIQTAPAEGETSKLYKLSVGDLDSYFTADGDGTVRGVLTTLPLQDDGDTVTPTISIREATTSVDGSVHRLATEADVSIDNNAPSERAVVTANLLNKTNNDLLYWSYGILGNEESIDLLAERVDGIESDLAALTLVVTQVESDVEDNASEITALKAEIESLQSQLDNFESDIDGGIYAPID